MMTMMMRSEARSEPVGEARQVGERGGGGVAFGFFPKWRSSPRRYSFLQGLLVYFVEHCVSPGYCFGTTAARGYGGAGGGGLTSSLDFVAEALGRNVTCAAKKLR